MLPEPDITNAQRVLPIAERRARLATLRVQLAELEGHTRHGSTACLSLGAPEIHAHLPTPGLAGGVLHEMAGATYGDRPAAFGFAVAVMAIAASSGGDARATPDGAAGGSLSPPLSGPPQGQPHHEDPESNGERDGVKGSKKPPPLHGLEASAQRLRPLVDGFSPAGRGGGASTVRLVSNPNAVARDLLPAAGPAFLVVTRRALAHFGRPYGRGLDQAGLDTSRLILIETRSDKEALWALEEVLGSDARPAVVAGTIETPLGLTESRRLNLAAARHGTPLLVLGAPGQIGTSAAATRWHIAAAPAGRDRFHMLAQPRWRIALERCRHGRPGEWLIEWDHAAYRFRLAARVADRTPAAGARLLRSAG
jgi:hypothetical protein